MALAEAGQEEEGSMVSSLLEVVQMDLITHPMCENVIDSLLKS
jgi:hypothetical protein